MKPEDCYVYPDGRIYNIKRRIFMKLNYYNGYAKILYGDKFTNVHKLVAEKYLGPRHTGYNINHIDGNKANNHILNLEYVTPSENILHAFKLGLSNQKGSRNAASLFTEQDILNIRDLYKTKSITEICEIYKAKYHTISAIVNRRNWKHI